MDVDLLVIGGGVAGATAAITASDLGARVVLVEKLSTLGGSCVYSAGNLIQLEGSAALDRLEAMAFSRTPDGVLSAYLTGLGTVRDWLGSLGARTTDVDARMLPNCWPNLPGADGVTYYTVDGGADGGPALWAVLEAALAARNVTVLTETSMTELITDDERVTGAKLRREDGSVESILATAGVVLATGGIENDASLTAAYLPVPGLRPLGNPGNTGDGLRVVQSIGAAVWHMSSFYGFWAYERPEFATAFPLLFFSPGHLIVDSDGRRFLAETGREPHDALRTIGDFLPDRANRPSLPAWVIFDEALLLAGPLCRFPSATGHRWSPDNLAELEAGWITEADTILNLAAAIGVDPAQLERTLGTYNRAAVDRDDAEFHRPAATMAPVQGDRLFAVQLWPGVATASAGPQRDERARVIRQDGSPIAGLFAAGGNGGIWGHLTEHGGGLTDGLVFGAIAAREALGSSREVPIGSLDCTTTIRFGPLTGSNGPRQPVRRRRRFRRERPSSA